MTGISLAKTVQDEKLTLSGYGFSMKISANSESVLFDAQGQEIVDVQQRIDAQKALVLPLIQRLGASLQQEMAALQQSTITDMSACLETSFTLPANNNEFKIGQVMPDGTVYAGISETTGTKMFAMPKDSGIMTWYNAIKFTQKLSDQYGYNGSKQATAEALDNPKKDDGGWRLPTGDELNQLFENKDDIGSFDSTDPWHWSSSSFSDNDNLAQIQRFTVGRPNYGNDKDRVCSVRCVRSEPRP
jgi:hypothetical protein